MGFYQVVEAITTSGNSGAATGSGTIELPYFGHIEYIYIDYNSGCHANTDVTISYANTPPGGNVLVSSNNITDTLFWPRAKAVDNTGAAITDSYDKFVASGDLSVAVAQSNAGTNYVTVYVGVSTP